MISADFHNGLIAKINLEPNVVGQFGSTIHRLCHERNRKPDVNHVLKGVPIGTAN